MDEKEREKIARALHLTKDYKQYRIEGGPAPVKVKLKKKKK